MISSSSSDGPGYKRLDFLLHLQESFPVGRWRVSGVDLWPILRVSLGRDIKRQHSFPSTLSILGLRQFIGIARQLAALIWHPRPKLPGSAVRASVVLFEPRPRARTLVPIRDFLDNRGIRTHDLGRDQRARPCFRELAVALWQARELRVPSFSRVKRSAKLQLGYLPPSLTRIGLLLKTVEMRLAMNRFESILRSLRADYIFSVRSLVDSLALVAAGRQLGITTTLVQGGLLDPDNNYLAAHWGRPISASLPDIYWAWSRDLAGLVRRNNVAKTVLPGGNTVLIDAHRTAQSFRVSDGGNVGIYSSELKRLRVLVLLSPGEEVPLNWLDQMDSCEVILRSHPGQKKLPREVLSWARHTHHRVELQNPRKIALACTVQKADFGFCGASASVFEFSASEIPVFVPTHLRDKLVANLPQRNEWIFFCQSGRQLNEQTRNLREIREKPRESTTVTFKHEVAAMETALYKILHSDSHFRNS